MFFVVVVVLRKKIKISLSYVYMGGVRKSRVRDEVKMKVSLQALRI